MVNRNLVASKLAELSERIDRVESHCPSSALELMANRDTLDLVSFNLMLAVQTCLNIASHLIADEGWPTMATMAAAFRSLEEHGVLTNQTANALSRAVGLRNIVAHGYSGVDVQLVHQAATQGVQELQRFASEVGLWLLRQPFST